MPKSKKSKTFTCPHCKKKLTTVLYWQTCSVAYEMILGSGGDFLDTPPRIEGGDFEDYCCPHCGITLNPPAELL